jgi:hypothetical protein
VTWAFHELRPILAGVWLPVSTAFAFSFVLAKGQKITSEAVMDSLAEYAGAGPRAVLSRFRADFHACLSAGPMN